MLNQETLDNHHQLLAAHRRTLAVLLAQQARLGDYAPAHIVTSIEDAQTAIRDLKTALRSFGVEVANEPHDDMPVLALRVAPTTRVDRNREVMLQKVRAIWIDGLLAHSLVKETRITLDFRGQPGVLHLPLNTRVQELNHLPHDLPPGTSITDVFNAYAGEVLILGAPGAGKTTLLLELADELLTRAAQDTRYPIPVIFNLSSWASKRLPLTQWLTDELRLLYDVPRKVAQEWIGEDLLLLLLDGLDEVQVAHREACVSAINEYRGEHGFVPLVVCSRISDYTALTAQLMLRGAVLVMPLTLDQVDTYLAAAGPQLTALRTALRTDTILQELTESPLMLNVMMVVAQQAAPGTVLLQGSFDERRTQLFATYVRQMFARRSLTTRYATAQTLHWLGWLAQMLRQRQQSVFLLEQLQYDWLPTSRARRWYLILDRWAIALLLGGIVAMSAFRSAPTLGLMVSQLASLTLGITLSIGLFGGKDSSVSSSMTVVQAVLWVVLSGFIVGFGVGSIIWLGYTLTGIFDAAITAAFPHDPSAWVDISNFAGLLAFFSACLYGALTSLVSGRPSLRPRHIVVMDKLRWSRTRAWRSALTAGCALWVGVLVFSVLLPVAAGDPISAREVLTSMFSSALLGLIGGFAFGFLGGLTSGVVEQRIRPNEGIQRSGRNSLIIGVVVGVSVTLLSGLAGGALLFIPAHTVGLWSGLVVALAYGGYTLLSHYILRLLLWKNGVMPLNYSMFLDYCVERIFLRKVGGGYIFVHRLLLEYFAALEINDNERVAVAEPNE